MGRISKVLIANRGEIAVRIIHAARQMGIRSVAVFSEADASANHVHLADEAVPIGEAEPSKSYLSIERILDAARQTGADAIHPGYGFLSERPEFAEACETAGIIFVGPPASAMRQLGAKIEAKQLAVSLEVPVTPGYFEIGATTEELERAAEGIGYPIMLKASAGGGGRGMRIVRDPSDFRHQLDLASEEALKAFGDGAMMIEKLVERPRHVEVQVLADQHGNIAALFERECSIQRRHQKLIEEAPSPVVEQYPELWQTLRDSAIKLVRGSGYTNAGTIEFMVDEASREVYFLEVNARLQVEHPVTELVTGLDLVHWQLRVASGEVLDLPEQLMDGDRRALSGHAIEARVVAEDPSRDFLPSVGRIVGWSEPRHPGVRLDTGYSVGSEISRYYDSLVAKVIATGQTRQEAISKLDLALQDFHVLGIRTNIPYLLDIMRHEQFRSGEIDTGFIGRELTDWSQPEELPEELGALAAFAGTSRADPRDADEIQPASAWAGSDAFRNAKN